MSARRIDVGILGATGVVGQHFVALLADHPWFRVTWLAASERSAGQRYGDLAWRLPSRLPAEAAALRVSPLDAVADAPSLLFSALDASVAGEAEVAFAASGRHVVSNARNHRMDPLVPLLIPEVNPDHLSLLDHQRRARGWTGSLVTNPNCSTVVVAMVLGALRQFQPTRVLVTTLQALSGAGYPGVASLDALGNVIPYIGGGEEEKIETETLKLLGRYADGAVTNADFVVSAQVNRVPVPDGHTAVMSFELATEPSIEDVSRPRSRRFPPSRRNAGFRPRRPTRSSCTPRRTGRSRGSTSRSAEACRCTAARAPLPVLGYKLVAMGHNVIRGAAGAALLNAELMVARG